MRIALACLTVFSLAAPAAAQAQRPEAVNQVFACAAIAGESERLACYDSAVGRMRQAESSGELLAVDRAQAQEIERQAFGFQLPGLPRLFGGGGDRATAPAITEARMEIARVSRRPNQPAVFTMTNGQVWTQVGTENSRNAREGGAVTVRRAALGSFLMSVEAGGAAVRVRRSE